MMVLAFAAHHCQVAAAPTKTTTLTFAPSEIEKRRRPCLFEVEQAWARTQRPGPEVRFLLNKAKAQASPSQYFLKAQIRLKPGI